MNKLALWLVLNRNMRRKIFLVLFLVIPALVFVLGGMWFFNKLNARKAQQQQGEVESPVRSLP